MRAAVLLMTVGLIAACAPQGARRVLDGRRVQLDVPFFPDGTDQCGPSALASVLTFWGRAETPASLKPELYRPKLKGALTVDLLLAAQNRGLSADTPEGGLARVKKELDEGRPVIAFVNLGFRFYPIGHYIVVTGYDDGREIIVAHSGTRRDSLISYGKFDTVWEKTNRWFLLIQPRA
jgi:hypothetical protein